MNRATNPPAPHVEEFRIYPEDAPAVNPGGWVCCCWPCWPFAKTPKGCPKVKQAQNKRKTEIRQGYAKGKTGWLRGGIILLNTILC